jgi:hypothetical protein
MDELDHFMKSFPESFHRKLLIRYRYRITKKVSLFPWNFHLESCGGFVVDEMETPGTIPYS